MKVFILVLAVLLSSCASTPTDKDKEAGKKLNIIRTTGCILVPTLPICILTK